MHAPSKADLLRRQRDFFQIVGACVAAIVLIHAIPKSRCPHDTLRLVYTVVYFAALVGLCLQMLRPRQRYLARLYAWRFEDAPPAMERAWQRYVYSLDRVLGLIFGLGAVFLASTAMSVLSAWFPPLRALGWLCNLAWWVSLAALVLLPFFGGFLFNELAQRYRSLTEETALSTRYQPRRLVDLRNPTAGDGPEPLEIGPAMAFRAGGFQWGWDDFRTNCVVFGQPGSGKTVCVLNSLLDGLLGSARQGGQNPSGLILDPKGDFSGKLRTLCQRHGLGGDLLVIDPESPDRSIRWNPLDCDDDEMELASRFAAVLEILGMKGGETSFWIDSARKFFRHALALVRLTNPAGQPPSFPQIYELTTSFQAIARRTDRLDIRDPRVDSCLTFFAEEWLDMAHETRTSIQAHVTNMLDPFLMEPYATMFAGRSTCRIQDMVASGKILYVHMPIARREAMTRTIGTLVKLEYFRQVLQHLDKKRPSFFLCDEFQVFFTTGQGKGDSDFFERSRQSNHANLVATQNIPAFLKTSPQREPVTNLLGNCAVKIFLRNTDQETNEYGANLFGQHLVGMVGAQGTAGGGRLGSLGRSVGSNDQYDQVVRPERFATLAIPSRSQDVKYCESLVHLASRPEVDPTPRKLRWKVHPLQSETEPALQAILRPLNDGLDGRSASKEWAM